MKRSFLMLAAVISFIVASLAFISADEPKYKNLKILKKDISKHDLDSVMHFFSKSLGEKCGFCHLKNDEGKITDFASDGNPNKGTARFMMNMTAKINKKYFKDQDKDHENQNGQTMAAVTCYTCHHGMGHPAVQPEAGPGNNMGMQHDMKPPPPSGDSARMMPADSMKGH